MIYLFFKKVLQSMSMTFGMKTICHVHLIVVGISLCLLFIPLAAFANSPPPPPMVWIDFQDWSESIDAVQVLACDSPQCQQPQIFAQYGRCTITGCAGADGPPKPVIPANPEVLGIPKIRLDCQNKACLMAGQSYEAAWQPDMQYQLRVRSGDRVRSSPTFSAPATLDQAWSVSQVGDALQIALGDAWDRQKAPALHWGMGFILTLATEFLVLSGVLRWMKQDRLTWLRTYMSFGLMHLVTYPLVWTLPMGLLPFQPRIERFLGFGELLVALLYLGFLYYLRRAKAWRLIAGSLFLLACLHFLVVLVALAFSYGQWLPFTRGINFGIAIAGTELLITAYEAIVLHILSRRKLSLWQTSVMSVLMNGTSLGIGILFWQMSL